MSFANLLKVSTLSLFFFLSINLTKAQISASLNPVLTIKDNTTIVDHEENTWLSVAETVLVPSKVDKTTTLAYTLAKSEKITIDLSDTEGRIIKKYTRNAKRNAGDYKQKLTLPFGLPEGVYFLNIASASGKVSVKVKHG